MHSNEMRRAALETITEIALSLSSITAFFCCRTDAAFMRCTQHVGDLLRHLAESKDAAKNTRRALTFLTLITTRAVA